MDDDKLDEKSVNLLNRIPLGTFFVIGAYLIFDRENLLSSLQSSMDSFNIQIDLSLLTDVSSLTSIDNFNSYTLTEAHIHTAIFFYLIVLISVCVCSLLYMGEQTTYDALNKENDKSLRKKARKRLSWGPSCFNSGLLTVVGFIYMGIKTGFFEDYDITRIVTYAYSGRHIWREKDNFSVLTMIWFGMFNITDMTFGSIFAFEALDPLTTWVHHPVFTWIMLSGITGNGIVFQGEPYCSAFMFGLIEELPTFWLALGSIWPSYRSDWGFGLTMFVFRICYHLHYSIACFLFDAVSTFKGDDSLYIHTTPKACYFFSMVMHIFWFKVGWLDKQLPKLLGYAKKDKEGKKEK